MAKRYFESWERIYATFEASITDTHVGRAEGKHILVWDKLGQNTENDEHVYMPHKIISKSIPRPLAIVMLITNSTSLYLLLYQNIKCLLIFI